MVEKVVIAGGGHAAGQVVASLKQKQFDGEILMLGDEPWYPYQRPPLSKKFLAGELPAERLLFKPESFYDDPAVEIRLNIRVASVDPENRSIETETGERVTYDKLVLATGARVRRLPVPGVELDGVHYLRNIADVTAIREGLEGSRRVAIIGAGYIGLEVAAVARQLGHDVTVIEMQDRVMSRVVSPQVSIFYQNEHTGRGVDLILSTGLKGFSGGERVSAVELEHGEQVATDLVVIGIGIQPNTELAAEAGLEVSDGIVVDDRGLTSDPDIYAVGDCTFHPNELLGTSLRLESVHNAVEQAKTAAANICGEDAHYAQVPWFWSDQYDLKLQIAGISAGYDDTVIRGDPASRSFSCAYLRDGCLIAIDAVNRPRDFMQSKALIAAHAVIDPEQLADGEVALKDMA